MYITYGLFVGRELCASHSPTKVSNSRLIRHLYDLFKILANEIVRVSTEMHGRTVRVYAAGEVASE